MCGQSCLKSPLVSGSVIKLCVPLLGTIRRPVPPSRQFFLLIILVHPPHLRVLQKATIFFFFALASFQDLQWFLVQVITWARETYKTTLLHLFPDINNFAFLLFFLSPFFFHDFWKNYYYGKIIFHNFLCSYSNSHRVGTNGGRTDRHERRMNGLVNNVFPTPNYRMENPDLLFLPQLLGRVFWSSSR